jgi:hypothetical protein
MQILNVAGDASNKAFQAALNPQVWNAPALSDCMHIRSGAAISALAVTRSCWKWSQKINMFLPALDCGCVSIYPSNPLHLFQRHFWGQQVPKDFKRPKTITSYSQYLKYAGQASGILPITPEAEAPMAAEMPLAAGPSSAVGMVLIVHSSASGTSLHFYRDELHAQLSFMRPMAASWQCHVVCLPSCRPAY